MSQPPRENLSSPPQKKIAQPAPPPENFSPPLKISPIPSENLSTPPPPRKSLNPPPPKISQPHSKNISILKNMLTIKLNPHPPPPPHLFSFFFSFSFHLFSFTFKKNVKISGGGLNPPPPLNTPLTDLVYRQKIYRALLRFTISPALKKLKIVFTIHCIITLY